MVVISIGFNYTYNTAQHKQKYYIPIQANNISMSAPTNTQKSNPQITKSNQTSSITNAYQNVKPNVQGSKSKQQQTRAQVNPQKSKHQKSHSKQIHTKIGQNMSREVSKVSIARSKTQHAIRLRKSTIPNQQSIPVDNLNKFSNNHASKYARRQNSQQHSLNQVSVKSKTLSNAFLHQLLPHSRVPHTPNQTTVNTVQNSSNTNMKLKKQLDASPPPNKNPTQTTKHTYLSKNTNRGFSLNKLRTMDSQTYPYHKETQLQVILEAKLGQLRHNRKNTSQSNLIANSNEAKTKIKEKLMIEKQRKTAKKTEQQLSEIKNRKQGSQSGQTNKQKLKQKLLQKIPHHRQIRSTSKISSKIIELNQFFKQAPLNSSRITKASMHNTLHNFNSKSNMKLNNIRINSQIGLIQKQPQSLTTHRLSQEQLENTLKLKVSQQNDSLKQRHRHKTQYQSSSQFKDEGINNQLRSQSHSNINDINQLRSYRLAETPGQTGSSLGFVFGVTHLSRFYENNQDLHNKVKLKDILKKDELNNSKQVIKINQQMRKSFNIRPNPKQWQFHNCLSLQKIQLYSTNLKISCEGWTVLDHIQLKYLRGWNPKAEDDFSPMIRLFIAKIAFSLSQWNGLGGFSGDLNRILVRVNDRHIYEDQKQKIRQKGQKIRGLAPHSILSLKKLVTSMLITSYNDLVIHSILALGYILYMVNSNPHMDQDPLAQVKKQSQYHIFIKTTQRSTLQTYCQHFQRQCKKICQLLDLNNTRVVVGFNCLYSQYNKKHRLPDKHDYTVVSSPLDVSILFMKCLGQKDFRDMMSHRIYQTEIKFQVGWNFWETRMVNWPNQQYVKYRFKAVGGRNHKNNQCFVIWDDQRDLIIAMSDCKVNMHWKDTERIQDWVEKHIGRFTKKYYLNMSFYPTDTQKFHKIN